MIELDSYSSNIRNRIKSPVLWGAMFTLVIFVLKKYFNVVIPDVDMLIDLIMAVLIGFGIVNNPTNKEGL